MDGEREGGGGFREREEEERERERGEREEIIICVGMAFCCSGCCLNEHGQLFLWMERGGIEREREGGEREREREIERKRDRRGIWRESLVYRCST